MDKQAPEGKWIRPSVQLPPSGISVVTWRGDGWGHGWYEHDTKRWFFSCEGFSGDVPDYWMIPASPDSASTDEQR